MTIRDALESGLDRADAEILLAFALGKERTWLLAHDHEPLSAEDTQRWMNIVKRRKAHEPVAYITGTQAFYGRDFFVSPSVLIPRPATEQLVELALHMLDGEEVHTVTPIDQDIVAYAHMKNNEKRVQTIVDIGTGSGCIAVTLACERPNLHIIATDISEEALQVAQKNAKKFHVESRIEFRQGSRLEPLRSFEHPFLIVSNPPYIPKDTRLMPDVVNFEPHSALFSGEKGTDVLEKILSEAKNNPQCMGYVFECMEQQLDF